jgi:chromosome segregation ATPase
MNIQDIADFIDLVKNPAKYERVLKNIQEEQARLNAVVETVGKAAELDTLRKEVEVKSQKLDEDAQKKFDALDKKVTSKLKSLEASQAKAEEELKKANTLQLEATAAKVAADELLASFSSRDKALRKAEEEIAARLADISAKEQELSDRLTKLRSVMG